MVIPNDGSKKPVTVNEPRFPIAISGGRDPAEILAAVESARRRAVISTLCVSPGDTRCAIALDTTGLDPEADEIIGICILDRSSDRVVYSERFMPVKHTNLTAARKTNGASPVNVSSCRLLCEKTPAIQAIIESYRGGVVAYNAGFVAAFLRYAGVDLEGVPFADPMVEYAHYRDSHDANPCFVTLSQAMSEIDCGSVEVPMDIACRARCASAVQEFLDTYYASITEQLCH